MKMKRMSQGWNTLALVPIAIAVVISAGFEWILKLPLSTGYRQSLNRLRKSTDSKPQPQVRWIAVTENGKRQLRMQWSTPANNDIRRSVA